MMGTSQEAGQLDERIPDPMVIERITVSGIRVPLGRTYSGSHYRMTHRSTLITRVYCRGGIVGEAYCGDEDATLSAIAKVITDELSPKLIGLDARAVENCWHQMRPATFDILRDRRIGLVATASVDTAIWDAVGRHLQVPLWRLWGGFTDRLPVISIGGYYGSDLPLGSEVEHLRSEGLFGMKLKVGGLSPDEDAARVRLARRVAGDDFAIAVDANQAWTPREAIRFAQQAEEVNIAWFEEPCLWDNDVVGMRDVRLATGVPVCAGQSEYSAAGCRRLIEAGAIDVCNFDSSWSGGPTEWRRAAAIAQTAQVKMAHHEEPQVAAHLLAAVPNGTYLEQFSPERDPVWHGLIENRPALRDGYLHLTESPGLGWHLDPGFIERYRVQLS